MPNQAKGLILLLPIVIFSLVLLALKTPLVFAATANHVVISEVQVAGATADDEFVEIYNPTNSAIDMTGWRLTKKIDSGTESNLVASISGTIAPRGYYLIAPAVDYVGSVLADLNYSTSNRVTANNTVLLYSDAGTTLVDKVGMGSATDVEASAAALPTANKSIERKANSSSTIESMTSGVDVNAGNGEDSDNNSNDFVLREVSGSQNAAAATEPVVESPSPSPTATPTPTVTPSPSSTPVPTVTPSATPSPTPVPTVTPTPSPTVTPSPTPSPSMTPSPTPRILAEFKFSRGTRLCVLNYREINIMGRKFQMPNIDCHWMTS